MSNRYEELSIAELKHCINKKYDSEIVREINKRHELLMAQLQQTDAPDEQLQKDAIALDAGLISYIKNPSKKMKLYAIEQEPKSIKYIQKPDEELQLRAVSLDPETIRYLSAPSEEVQLTVIQQDSGMIKYIKKPTDMVKALAVLDSGDNIHSIKNPNKTLQIIAAQQNPECIIGKQTTDEIVQMVAVQNDWTVLEYIKNPSVNVQRMAVKQNIRALKFVTDPQIKAAGISEFNKQIFKLVRRAFDKLCDKRFFVSEADFQHALATELRNELDSAEFNVYLEFPIYQDGKVIYIDIMIETESFLYPIELKYKTKNIDWAQPYEDTGVAIKDILKDHGAQDLGGYYFWKDINRIETLIANKQVMGGICIFVTNDAYYLLGSGKEDAQAQAFRVSNGWHFKGHYDWRLKDESNVPKYISDCPGLDIQNDYNFQWQRFLEMVPKNGKFWYLFVEVPYFDKDE